MSNLSSLADRYAEIKSEVGVLEETLKALRSEILGLGQEFVEGEKCRVQICLSERESLDTALARKFLSNEELKECLKKTLIETLRIKAKI